MKGIVNEIEAAKILNLGVQTLRNWRQLRKGPPYMKFGRAVRYALKDLFDYAEHHKIDPERPKAQIRS